MSNGYFKLNMSEYHTEILLTHPQPLYSHLYLFLPSITRNSLFLVVQAKNLGVILDSSFFSHPESNLSVNPVSSIHPQNDQNPILLHHVHYHDPVISSLGCDNLLNALLSPAFRIILNPAGRMMLLKCKSVVMG